MNVQPYPFDYDPSKPFIQQAGEWIADVFYDILPEAGFEVRDEQIYMAFQLERAFAEKSVIFAEAGVGTGKTIVYLLYSICYARYMRKPVVIACADESLIEQLMKPEGDLAKLSLHLDFTIDARTGKSPEQYLCLNKLDEARFGEEDEELYEELYEGLPEFVRARKGMQHFHAYGDRKHYPGLSDEQWGKIGWDRFQDCFVCEQRHRCGQTLSRDHYRRAADLIVCSHDFYMEHVWTYESRKREGQLPLLPDHAAVVFDEGHLLEAAAQKALTYKLKHESFEELITRLLKGEIRETLAERIEDAIGCSESLFRMLERQSDDVAGSDRRTIRMDDALRKQITSFQDVLSAIEEELVFESGLYTLNEYQLKIVEEHLEMIQRALSLFRRSEPPICWLSEGDGGTILEVMPRTVKEVLRERVFALNMPIVFSSATLSVDGSFDYLAESLGVSDSLSFSVASPYQYEEQMEVVVPNVGFTGAFEEKLDAACGLLKRTGGRALLLFRSREELRQFKAGIANRPDLTGMRFLFEGDQEISSLISQFQADETSVLGAISLWEGLDVPGPSLSNVIVWSLPYPPNDPVFMAKRSSVRHPFEEVDLPYMLLRLRQGIGRLIRTREDKGIVALLSEQWHQAPEVRAKIEAVLPNGVTVKEL